MLAQDFAIRTSSKAQASNIRQGSKAHLPTTAMLPMITKYLTMKSVYIPILTALLLLPLLTTFASLNVDASVQISHEEWLPVEAIKLLSQATKHQKTSIQKGDSAITALHRLGFSYADVMAMQQASKAIHPLHRIQANHSFTRNDSDDVIHVYYNLSAEQQLHLYQDPQGWHAELLQAKISPRMVYVEAIIHDSLFADAAKAGLDNRTTMNLVDVFAWDIDFARDLRKNDRFQVLYQEKYNDQGNVIGTTIIAATFINQGREYHAIRYHLKNGTNNYYSLDGKSLRKAYLKSPVKYSRISSRFKRARKHPVLGYTRAHKGVDYAAGRGTPIHALGDGRITFAGWNGGYGRLIKIRHTNRDHSTRYGHMSRFGRGIHKGVHVKQGQIIGYVGMSGLATGPHLHFEFRIRGRAVNPLHVKHTPAKPVPKSELAAFKQQSTMLEETIKLAKTQQQWG